MRVRSLTSLAAASLLLLITGCAGQQETLHPIDAAESFLGALADGDTERMCELIADSERGPFSEQSPLECERWADQVVSQMDEGDRRAFGEARVDSVTLAGSDAAQVLAEDFEAPPPRLSGLELIEWSGQWYVEDVHFND